MLVDEMEKEKSVGRSASIEIIMKDNKIPVKSLVVIKHVSLLQLFRSVDKIMLL